MSADIYQYNVSSLINYNILEVSNNIILQSTCTNKRQYQAYKQLFAF